MKKRIKKSLSGMYLCACLMAMCFEPADNKSMKFFLTYYAFIVANTIIATILVNNHFKNVPATN